MPDFSERELEVIDAAHKQMLRIRRHELEMPVLETPDQMLMGLVPDYSTCREAKNRWRLLVDEVFRRTNEVLHPGKPEGKRKRRIPRKLTSHEGKAIIRHYKRGDPVVSIVKLFGRGYASIYQVLEKAGIDHRRPRGGSLK